MADGILASLDIFWIFMMIEKEYDIKVLVMELNPSNFNSAAAMYAMIECLEDV